MFSLTIKSKKLYQKTREYETLWIRLYELDQKIQVTSYREYKIQWASIQQTK